ncbi:hypothetical protein [Thermostaphylospora chromogena]|uniref:Uncharacterized protein n=1 Tax=Thermostaphylospora chromogena TaxID=35622 RepID=A0A1H1DVY7_9ACTN|nr:hypothetical protein [Thermostaphylospora chromogena]SDQ80086.1 hypothetical protein SAMN04489764_2175 [Thermostaphylospora chromogena]
MSRVPLRLERINDRDVHDDLMLRLGTYRHVCDSYYLAVDESARAGQEVSDSLVRLLDQWGEHLQRVRLAGGTVFLPFDFSDQCTAWLRVSSPDGRRATVEAGWSGIEGWSFRPSDFAETARRVHDFDPIVNASVECDLDDLIAAVAQNRDSLARHAGR